LDFDKLDKCYDGSEGNAAQLHFAKKTMKLDPAKQYVPWITVNDKYDEHSESLIMKDLKKFVCKNAENGAKMDGCSELL